jgi:hypothetical protein
LLNLLSFLGPSTILFVLFSTDSVVVRLKDRATSAARIAGQRILNLFFVWNEKSSGAVPFATLVSLLVLWLGISVPLVYLGSYIAFRKPAHEHLRRS